jgi:hypothetical protein
VTRDPRVTDKGGDRAAPRRAKPILIDVTVPNAARAADFF